MESKKNPYQLVHDYFINDKKDMKEINEKEFIINKEDIQAFKDYINFDNLKTELTQKNLELNYENIKKYYENNKQDLEILEKGKEKYINIDEITDKKDIVDDNKVKINESMKEILKSFGFIAKMEENIQEQNKGDNKNSKDSEKIEIKSREKESTKTIEGQISDLDKGDKETKSEGVTNQKDQNNNDKAKENVKEDKNVSQIENSNIKEDPIKKNEIIMEEKKEVSKDKEEKGEPSKITDSKNIDKNKDNKEDINLIHKNNEHINEIIDKKLQEEKGMQEQKNLKLKRERDEENTEQYKENNESNKKAKIEGDKNNIQQQKEENKHEINQNPPKEEKKEQATNAMTPEMVEQYMQFQQMMIQGYLLSHGAENNFLNSYSFMTNTQSKEPDPQLPQVVNGIIKLDPNIPSLGLNNVGATCYMNATLQCLIHIKELSEVLLSAFLFKYPRDNLEYYTKHKLSNLYVDILSQVYFPKLHGNTSRSFAPYAFKNYISEINPLFQGVQANDAKDLLQCILENIHGELKQAMQYFQEYEVDQRSEVLSFQYFLNYYISQNKSPINDFLYGIQKTTSTCLKCNTIKYNFQSFNLLYFPLKEAKRIVVLRKKKENEKFDEKKYILNLEDCFAHSEQVEHFTGENQFYCNICNGMNDADYQTLLYATPTIMAIVLNRGRANKDFQEEFIFKTELDIKKYIHNPGCKHGKYYLIGMVVHSGESSMAGHFIAYCRMDKNAKWFCYNDAWVTECNNIEEKLSQNCPYILFYHYDNEYVVKEEKEDVNKTEKEKEVNLEKKKEEGKKQEGENKQKKEDKKEEKKDDKKETENNAQKDAKKEDGKEDENKTKKEDKNKTEKEGKTKNEGKIEDQKEEMKDSKKDNKENKSEK